MKVLVQWAAATPSDWIAVDSADWAALPSKPEPVGGEIIDATPGWICQICVQGMSFTGDHYAVLHDTPTGGCTVYCWSDDPGDFQPEDYFGHVTTFLPLAPDPKFGGAYNTRQTRQFYGGAAKRKLYADSKIDALPFAVQIWLFASPVAYPINEIDESWRWIYALVNPVVGPLEGFRRVLALGHAPDWGLLGLSTVSSIVLLTIGFRIFKRLEREFADVV